MRIRCGILALIQLGAFLALVSRAAADLITPGSFQVLAVHPDAQTQSTERGRTIASIASFDGHLYLGYGDWNWDTGPISIRSLNPNTQTWSGSLLTVATEAVSHFRELDGKLYAPIVDPLGPPGASLGGFALGVSNGGGSTWTQVATVATTHVFDVVSRDGADLWLVGSLDSQGAIWRSTDGGQSFNAVRLDDPAPGSASFVFSRYVGAGVYMDRLFVQRVDINGAPVDSSLVFDGTSWTPGPDLITQSNNGYMFRPTTFQNELVYMDNDKNLGNLYRFDGTQARLAFADRLRDFFVKNDRLYGLTEFGQLIETSDLDAWTVLGTAPGTARSIAVVGSDLYLGTTDASILSTTMFEPISAVPEPSAAVAIGCAAIITMARNAYPFAVWWPFRRRRRV